MTEDLLATARVAYLATASADGRPHVVPIVFVWRDGVLYTPLDLKPKRVLDPRALRRVKNLLANPRVAVVVDRHDEDWSRLAFVLVEGRATLLESGPEYAGAIIALVDKYPQYEQLPLAGRPLIRVEAEKTTSWSARGTALTSRA